jgi:hypothetical protein
MIHLLSDVSAKKIFLCLYPIYSQLPAVVIFVLEPNLNGFLMLISLSSFLSGSIGEGFHTSIALTSKFAFFISSAQIRNLVLGEIPGTKGRSDNWKFGYF